MCGDLIEAVGEGSWVMCLVKVVRMFENTKLYFMAAMCMETSRSELATQGWGEKTKLSVNSYMFVCLFVFSVYYLMEAGNLSNEESIAFLSCQR